MISIFSWPKLPLFTPSYATISPKITNPIFWQRYQIHVLDHFPKTESSRCEKISCFAMCSLINISLHVGNSLSSSCHQNHHNTCTDPVPLDATRRTELPIQSFLSIFRQAWVQWFHPTSLIVIGFTSLSLVPIILVVDSKSPTKFTAFLVPEPELAGLTAPWPVRLATDLTAN